MYGSDLTPRAILSGKVPPLAAAPQFLATVRGAKTVAENKVSSFVHPEAALFSGRLSQQLTTD
jgi:hypothetical protein